MNAKLGLRKLKEQQSKKRIDHPLASNIGQLSCVVCNIPLKSDLLWVPHLQSKKHKEAVADLKSKGTSAIKSSSSTTKVSGQVTSTASAAKRKHDQISLSKEELENKPNGDAESGTIKKNMSSNSSLPTDFFDASSSPVEQPSFSQPKPSSSQSKPSEPSTVSGSSNEKQENASTNPSSSKKISELLPEGFFDDAKLDAKARKVEYVDKQEEEWEEFQKMIATETKVSEDLQAEEEEEFKVEKDLTEYTALKQYLARVSKLKERREKMTEAPKKQQDVSEKDDESDSDSEEQIDDILNWRAKKA